MPDAPPPTLSDPLADEGIIIKTGMECDEAITALERAGRRGKLPGFARADGCAFVLDCDAIPFEYQIRGRVEPTPNPTDSPRSRVSLRISRKKLMPTVFAATLLFTIWPGVWLTDSLIATYWSAYGRWTGSMPWLTYAWYLPIAVLPLPWLWKSLLRKSEAMARESAASQITAIHGELNTEPAQES